MTSVLPSASVPGPINHHFQKTLTAQWLHSLPFLQLHAPVNYASGLLHQVLSNISDINTTPYSVIEFCSGNGGPSPTIERTVNARRKASGLPPITFRLSDLYPDLDVWMDLASQSPHLTFIPQSVDARKPPASTVTVTARPTIPIPDSYRYTDQEVTIRGNPKPDRRSQDERKAHTERIKRHLTADTKIIHLYCLAFHHFNDADARGVLRSSLRNSDAFIILELQERTLGSLAMMLAEPLLLWLVSWAWFWGDWTHLFLTYILPVLPFAHAWDGLVSCLRTRTLREMRVLIDDVLTQDRREKEDSLVPHAVTNGRYEDGIQSDWIISQARIRHTWPAGFMTATIGIRSDVRRETQ